MWPDLAKFRHSGEILQYLAKDFNFYLVFCKISNLICHICCVIGHTFIVINGQNWAHRLTICSHWWAWCHPTEFSNSNSVIIIELCSWRNPSARFSKIFWKLKNFVKTLQNCHSSVVVLVASCGLTSSSMIHHAMYVQALDGCGRLTQIKHILVQNILMLKFDFTGSKKCVCSLKRRSHFFRFQGSRKCYFESFCLKDWLTISALFGCSVITKMCLRNLDSKHFFEIFKSSESNEKRNLRVNVIHIQILE